MLAGKRLNNKQEHSKLNKLLSDFFIFVFFEVEQIKRLLGGREWTVYSFKTSRVGSLRR